MSDRGLSKERQLNIIWTIAENYDYYPESWMVSRIEEEDAESLKVYQSILLGAIDRFWDFSKLNTFLRNLHEQTNDGVLFETILLLCAEEKVVPVLLRERFAIESIRKKALSAIERRYFFENPKTLAEEIKKSYYMRKLGRSPSSNIKVRRLLDEMKKVEDTQDTSSFLQFIEDLFRKFFHFEFSLHGSSEEQDPKKKRNLFQIGAKSLERPISFDESMEKISEEYTSAEFSSNVTSMDSELQDAQKEAESSTVLEDTAEKGRLKVESIYGKASLSQGELQRLEKSFAIGVHQGQKIHLTKGILSPENRDEYRLRKMQAQRKSTSDFFNENILVHRRNIFRLRDVLLRSLSQDSENLNQKSSAGKLNSSKVWRSTKLTDREIFSRISKEGGLSFAVDILLDGSGSQIERQSVVAVQGYLLSQALSICNIPNRVCSFNNFLDFTVIRIFRDYDDPPAKNGEIFNYFASGSNRDGLALRIIGESLLQREEEHKILIVLSDGKPNDLRVQSKKSFGPKVKDYIGRIAVDDTAMEVRRARMNGISVFGVFTGEEEDLEAEKRIFGKDFVYIQHIEQFSDVVGHFLKREIANIIENC